MQVWLAQCTDNRLGGDQKGIPKAAIGGGLGQIKLGDIVYCHAACYRCSCDIDAL